METDERRNRRPQLAIQRSVNPKLDSSTEIFTTSINYFINSSKWKLVFFFFFHSLTSNHSANVVLQSNSCVYTGLRSEFRQRPTIKRFSRARNSKSFQNSIGASHSLRRLQNWSLAVLRSGRREHPGSSSRKTLSRWKNEGAEKLEEK